MNIFYIHENPTISAKAMSNKHVVKMILESAQLLSTAHHILDKSTSSELYKPTHKNHPSAIWVRQSYKNYQWLYNHFVSLCEEYTKRYNKVHKTEEKLKSILYYAPTNIKNKEFTAPPCAMPDKYKDGNSVSSYRKYYEAEKFFNEDDRLRYMSILNLQ
jgi:hypothetical protein